METKYFLFIGLMIFAVSLSSIQCGKGGINCTESIYSFNLGVKAYPDKDSLRIGDTLWFEINEPTTLKDARSGQMIDYSGAENLGSVISFHQLSASKQFSIPASNQFLFGLMKGQEKSVLDPSFEKQYVFSEEGQYYKFNLWIIPKQTGSYRILLSNAANVYRKSEKCKKAGFSINFKGTNQHYYQSPAYQGETAASGVYYFKVY